LTGVVVSPLARSADETAVKYFVTVNIPFAVDSSGQVWTDPLWAKDVECHAGVNGGINVVAPVHVGVRAKDWVRVTSAGVDDPSLRIRFHGVTKHESFLGALWGWRKTRCELIGAVGEADVVQLNVSGWPLPLGWVGHFVAGQLGKPSVVVVESAPWRSATGVKGWIQSRLFESMARRCVAGSAVSFFTHAGYRDTLTPPSYPSERKHVLHASWVDEKYLLHDRVRSTLPEAEPLRVLFAGRVVEAKGVRVLLDAAEKLPPSANIEISLVGDGDLLPECRQRADQSGGRVKVLPPKAYGDQFFDLLDRHDLLVVPSLTDEQPRVIYDAYARGLPAIASDTAGNRDCVFPGSTGWLVPTADPEALASSLARLSTSRGEVDLCSKGALAYVKNRTHEAMHRQRLRVIEDVFGPKHASHSRK